MATKDSIVARECIARGRVEQALRAIAQELDIDLTQPKIEAGGGPEYQAMRTLESLAEIVEQVRDALLAPTPEPEAPAPPKSKRPAKTK
jgi:hypothetical protein